MEASAWTRSVNSDYKSRRHQKRTLTLTRKLLALFLMFQSSWVLSQKVPLPVSTNAYR
jgi:hypothetical protein